MDYSALTERELIVYITGKRSERDQCLEKVYSIRLDTYLDKPTIRALADYYLSMAGHIYKNHILPAQQELSKRLNGEG